MMTEIDKAKAYLVVSAGFFVLMSGFLMWRAFHGIVLQRIPASTGNYTSNPEILGQDAVWVGVQDLFKIVVALALAGLCLAWRKKMDEG